MGSFSRCEVRLLSRLLPGSLGALVLAGGLRRYRKWLRRGAGRLLGARRVCASLLGCPSACGQDELGQGLPCERGAGESSQANTKDVATRHGSTRNGSQANADDVAVGHVVPRHATTGSCGRAHQEAESPRCAGAAACEVGKEAARRPAFGARRGAFEHRPRLRSRGPRGVRLVSDSNRLADESRRVPTGILRGLATGLLLDNLRLHGGQPYTETWGNVQGLVGQSSRRCCASCSSRGRCRDVCAAGPALELLDEAWLGVETTLLAARSSRQTSRADR
mmetsp:Transcript_78287/g.204024  ORF Transcript_78287/g.204024 Transcript_78287/m.204024 type:complete len:278 (+) Transcript_78287:644-1477(+)